MKHVLTYTTNDKLNPLNATNGAGMENFSKQIAICYMTSNGKGNKNLEIVVS